MITKIKKGRNNEVFLYKEKKQKIIIKKYKFFFTTRYDRFSTEKFFLEFLNKKKIRNVPKLIYSDTKEKINFLSYIDGRKVKKVKKYQLKSCLQFIKKINYRTVYKNFRFQKAADSCLSIHDHVQSCKTRITKLIKKNTNNKNIENRKILSFLEKEIEPAFKKINLEIDKKFSRSDKIKKINYKNMILSPSDFGFHNIIEKKNKLYFIDFEYAGWDDPIKLLCDFILNPDYTISNLNKNYFLDNFNLILEKKIFNPVKYRILVKFHFLKWVCVILNQLDIEISKKNDNFKYFKKAVNYFNKNKNILK